MARNESVDAEGAITLPPARIAPSKYISAEARAVLLMRLQMRVPPAAQDIAAIRARLDEFYFKPLLALAEARFDAVGKADTIAGVPVEFVQPTALRPGHNERLLIHLHGGGFAVGEGLGGRLEALPIAATTGWPVLIVNYRQAPEHEFPAASEDVAAVYAHLLRRYKPNQLALTGCSAGALLSAMSLAWFDSHGLPPPGAAALLFGGGDMAWSGDSMIVAPVLNGLAPPFTELASSSYLANADPNSPLASPVTDDALLSRFPPTFLASGGRAEDLSSVLHLHARLQHAGAESELHVWDGLWHAFHHNVTLPESNDLFAHLARFFHQRL